MANEDEDFSEQERLKMFRRAQGLVLAIRTNGEELQNLLDALRDTKKRSSKDLDEHGEPTFKFAVKMPIPPNFRMTKRMKQYALNKGFTATSVNPVWDEFVNYYKRTGTKWMDWYAVWQKWLRTELQRRAERGATGTSRDLQEF